MFCGSVHCVSPLTHQTVFQHFCAISCSAVGRLAGLKVIWEAYDLFVKGHKRGTTAASGNESFHCLTLLRQSELFCIFSQRLFLQFKLELEEENTGINAHFSFTLYFPFALRLLLWVEKLFYIFMQNWNLHSVHVNWNVKLSDLNNSSSWIFAVWPEIRAIEHLIISL